MLLNQQAGERVSDRHLLNKLFVLSDFYVKQIPYKKILQIAWGLCKRENACLKKTKPLYETGAWFVVSGFKLFYR